VTELANAVLFFQHVKVPAFEWLYCAVIDTCIANFVSLAELAHVVLD
jgi:hypothetical protein